jgi:oligopeptidase B
MGQPPERPVTLYEETEDKGFSVGADISQDRSLILLATGDNSSTEVRFVPANDPLAEPVLVSARRPNRIYSVDAAHGKLWILVNDEHVNFRIAEANPARPNDWTTVIAGSDQVYLRRFAAFRDHLLIQERLNGLDQIRLRSYDGQERRVRFPEASYTASIGVNLEFAPAAYRLNYSSMVTPSTTYDFHPADDRLEVLKVQEIPSGYDPSLYETARLMLPTRDGKQVPVSIVYPTGFGKKGEGKLYIYAYGAYGYAIPPSFSTAG